MRAASSGEKPSAGDRARPVALREDIRLRQQIAQGCPPLLALEFDKTRQLAAAGVDGEPRDRRQIGAGDQQHVGAMRGERAARDGTCDHPRQIEHAHARERTIACGPGFWRGLADLLDRDQRQSGQRLGVRRRRPFVMRAHHRDHAAAGIGRGLERLAVPLHQRGLNLVALRLAVQHLADGVAVMREIGVQPHEAPIAGLVDRRRSRPRPAAAACRRRADSARCGIRRRHGACRPRRPAPRPLRSFQISAAASPAAAMLTCAAAATRNDDGSCGSSPVSVTRVERGSLAAGGGPDIGENFAVRRVLPCDFASAQLSSP